MGADLTKIQCPDESCQIYESYQTEMRQFDNLGRHLEDFVYQKHSTGLDQQLNSDRVGFNQALDSVLEYMVVNLDMDDPIKTVIMNLAGIQKAMGKVENDFVDILNFVLLMPIQKIRINNLKEVRPAHKLLMAHSSKNNPVQQDIQRAHAELHKLVFSQNERFSELQQALYPILQHEYQLNDHNLSKVDHLIRNIKSDKSMKQLCKRDHAHCLKYFPSEIFPIKDYRMEVEEIKHSHEKSDEN